ncbi:MAG: TatD family hydrolase [Candidatus Heimdallarchaeota archaeon]|nr:MAG: TatD family hydrolase [Candidatus Heimdallarchaeota archaeon]
MYINTHFHLDDPWLKGDQRRQEAIRDIDRNHIVTLAQSCSIESYEKILSYSNQSKYIFPSFGILPWYAHEYIDRMEEVAELCEEALMLGEVGLDERNAEDKTCIPHQRPLFKIFLEAAEKKNLLMNLHFRGTEEEGLNLLKTYDVKKAIFHAYSGSLELMNQITDQGYYYSVGLSSLFLNRMKRRDLFVERVKNIPDDLLVVEIDELPTIEWFKMDFEVSSTLFPKIIKAIADIRNSTPEEIKSQCHENVTKLIGNDSRLMNIAKILKKH